MLRTLPTLWQLVSADRNPRRNLCLVPCLNPTSSIQQTTGLDFQCNAFYWGEWNLWESWAIPTLLSTSPSPRVHLCSRRIELHPLQGENEDDEVLPWPSVCTFPNIIKKAFLMIDINYLVKCKSGNVLKKCYPVSPPHISGVTLGNAEFSLTNPFPFLKAFLKCKATSYIQEVSQQCCIEQLIILLVIFSILRVFRHFWVLWKKTMFYPVIQMKVLFKKTKNPAVKGLYLSHLFLLIHFHQTVAEVSW